MCWTAGVVGMRGGLTFDRRWMLKYFVATGGEKISWPASSAWSVQEARQKIAWRFYEVSVIGAIRPCKNSYLFRPAGIDHAILRHHFKDFRYRRQEYTLGDKLVMGLTHQSWQNGNRMFIRLFLARQAVLKFPEVWDAFEWLLPEWPALLHSAVMEVALAKAGREHRLR